MSDNNSRNKLILKNTMFMYVRMLIMMLIALYTARVILQTLGVDDYGIYNVVGGIIVFFTILNNGLASASSRYITAEVGAGTKESGIKVFNVCLQAHAVIAFIIFLLAESVGLWIVNMVLKIPESRMLAANVVYQISIITAFINIIYSPFNTAILAYEKMNIYAYFAILDAFNKLLIVFILQVVDTDKLVLYAILVFIASTITSVVNIGYCFKKFEICVIRKVKDIVLLKSIFGFTSWSLIGQACIVGTNQGVTFLINYFCGVAVNAAMGVSNQVVSVVNQFVTNFQMAFRPQIVKSYVNNEVEYLKSLILRSSKISGCLMLIFVVPLLLETSNVLTLWLGKYLQYSIEFAQWALVAVFFDNLSGPLWMLINSQTKIKEYQIWTSVFYSLTFIGGWIVLLLNVFPPYYVIIVRLCVFLTLIGVRLRFTRKFFIPFNISEWLHRVLVRETLVLAGAYIVGRLLINYLCVSPFAEILIVSVAVDTIVVVASFYFILSESERSFFINFIKNKIHR